VEDQTQDTNQAGASPIPTAQRERISSIDTLRGFALLGILIMNISSFGLPDGIDSNPTALGPTSKLNLAVWVARFVLADGKLRAIFSMLFGAGVVLLTDRLEKRGEAARAADIFTRRNMWLTLFGILHGYFLWDGDVLYFYGITALLFLYPCRKLKARTLLIAGATVFLILAVTRVVRLESRIHLAERTAAATHAEKQGQALSKEQKEDRKAWQEVEENGHPSRESTEKEIADMRGGYVSVFKRYASFTVNFESIFYYRWSFCDALGMMLIGMGLLRMGFLSAQLSYKFYAWTAVLGYAAGLPLGVLCTWKVVRSGFDTLAILNWEYLPYDLQRLSVALAHASIVLMVVKAGALRWLTKPLAAVGQTALSNYLGTSLICTLIFNGYGLKLFGRLQFYQLFFVMGGVWVLNLIASPLWLKYFRFGPIEWAWRSLTYWKRQPIFRENTVSVGRASPAEA
jgi:uncharacterized protein